MKHLIAGKLILQFEPGVVRIDKIVYNEKVTHMSAYAIKNNGCASQHPDTGYIIESLLDTDFYKFTMGQVIFDKYPDVPVTYSFKNRTADICLAHHISEVDFRAELDHVQGLRFTQNDCAYLRNIVLSEKPLFSEPYLHFLQGLQLPSYEIRVTDGDFAINVKDNWAEAIYWETFILSIVNELYYRSLLQNAHIKTDAAWAEGFERLERKIALLKKQPQIVFSDFGTRRRFSRAWHDALIQILSAELPRQFAGTSNVYFARKYALMPIGTMAHEMFMVMSGIMHASDQDIYSSHNRVLQDWWDYYGVDLSIALTDTYGSDFFFQDLSPEQARNLKGLRQDSGDPIAFGEKAIQFYESCGIDPREKIIVFSDGLDIESINRLIEHFSGRIKMTFGWGTNLTNDLGFGALSLVVKVVESCGHGTVKLSDNLAKAIGTPEDIACFKRIFGYTGTLFETCRY
jgi:nicotinate phosphoribosyltransferase